MRMMLLKKGSEMQKPTGHRGRHHWRTRHVRVLDSERKKNRWQFNIILSQKYWIRRVLVKFLSSWQILIPPYEGSSLFLWKYTIKMNNPIFIFSTAFIYCTPQAKKIYVAICFFVWLGKPQIWQKTNLKVPPAGFQVMFLACSQLVSSDVLYYLQQDVV